MAQGLKPDVRDTIQGSEVNELIRSLRGLLGLRKPLRRIIEPGGDFPPVLAAPPLQIQPDISDPQLMEALKELEKLVPGISQRVTSASFRPDVGMFEELMRKNPEFVGKGVNPFPLTNLQGTHDRRTDNIAINPQIAQGNILPTLGHEISHGTGETEETIPLVVAEIIRALMAQGVLSTPPNPLRR